MKTPTGPLDQASLTRLKEQYAIMVKAISEAAKKDAKERK